MDCQGLMANSVIVTALLAVILNQCGRTNTETIQIPVEKYKDQTLECSVDSDDVSRVAVKWSTELDDAFEKQVSIGTTAIAPYVVVVKTRENDWNLRVNNITEDRDGIYICKYAIGNARYIEKMRYNVSIIPDRNDGGGDRPGVIVTKAIEGESIELKCKVDGYSPEKGKVTWYKMENDGAESVGELISENLTIYTEDAAIEYSDEMWILTLKNVKQTYDGRYICKVNVTEFSIYDVVVDKGAIFIKPQFHEKVTLTCVFPEPIGQVQIRNVLWKHGTRPLFPQEEDIQTILTDSKLTIARPTPSETDGVYTCGLNNKPFERCKFEIRVQMRPRLDPQHSSPNTVMATEGETLNLTCVWFGRPEPEVTWYRRQNIRDAPWEATGVKGSILIIPEITRYAGDEYICSAKNSHGDDTWGINVTVNFGPEVHCLEERVIYTTQQTFNLSCIVLSSPAPVMEWYNGEGKISSNYMYNVMTPSQIEGYPAFTMTLALLSPNNEELKSKYLGAYECRATLGGTEESGKIVVNEKDPENIPDVEVKKYEP